ncbi:MAG: PatB family C-S lyase [Lentisphaerae bacterium]|nr:PatB family C-S lyase [Lentisphaerota bacterium]
MTFDFDTVIDRRHTDSFKWRRYAGRDVLPLWVADMDFASPPEVLAALHARVDHGIFGYAEPMPSVIDAVMAMLEREYNWRIEAEWIAAWTPGVAVALHVVSRMLEHPEDAVLTSTPIYPPFLHAPLNMGRALRKDPLVERTAEASTIDHPTSRFEMAFDRLADALAPPTRAFLFCHPQNPTGRVWSRTELDQVAETCLRHGTLVCSDEVHNGLILDADKRHIPLATLSPEIAARTITLMSPSKTYNIAGLMCACAIIPDAALRRRFQRAARGIVNELTPFGYVACEAAYRHGEPWRQALLAYLRENRDLVEATVAALPGLRMNHVEATYLAWIDCRATGWEHPVATFEATGVGLSDGTLFGAPGWARLNFGCPRPILREALARMGRAFGSSRQPPT